MFFLEGVLLVLVGEIGVCRVSAGIGERMRGVM